MLLLLSVYKFCETTNFTWKITLHFLSVQLHQRFIQEINNKVQIVKR